MLQTTCLSLKRCNQYNKKMELLAREKMQNCKIHVNLDNFIEKTFLNDIDGIEIKFNDIRYIIFSPEHMQDLFKQLDIKNAQK